ncbi:MAG: hypothetical protein JKY84_06195 [Emcibacteraceae bacterium]|nr:hypothetical protein [Emcibacteraceae bacterium]
MTYINSVWNGEKNLAFTFWIVLIVGIFIAEIISFGFCTIAHNLLNESYICEINCDPTLKWLSTNISYSTIMVFSIFLKSIYIIFASISFYRSAMKDRSDKTGIKTGLAFVFWVIMVPSITFINIIGYINAVTYGSDYARAGYVFFL